MNYDIVAVGDCAVDAFVEVEEATISADIHHEHQKICFSFADKIPYKSLTMLSAGNANNVSVSMARFGFKSGFYGTVSSDTNGKIILDTLKSEKVSTELMSIQKNLPTNFHLVLWFRHERTILIRHQDFEYRLPKKIESAKWIYLTSVGKKGLSLHQEVIELLRRKPDIKMGFNPGTFQLRMGLKKLAPLLKRTEILFLNQEEAEMLVGKQGKPLMLAQSLKKSGPDTIIITDALNGSHCLAGNKFYYVGVYPHIPYETTGCGDAFASGFTAARMFGLPVDQALIWGSRQGASVATKIGSQAGLVGRKQMLSDLAKYPDFKAKLLETL